MGGAMKRAVGTIVAALLLLLAQTARAGVGDCSECSASRTCAPHQRAERETLDFVAPYLASSSPASRISGYQRLGQLSSSRKNAPSRVVAERIAKGLEDEADEVRLAAVSVLGRDQHRGVAIAALCKKTDEVARRIVELQKSDPNAARDLEKKLQRENEMAAALAKALDGMVDDRVVDALIRLLSRLEPAAGPSPGGASHAAAVKETASTLTRLKARRGVEAVVSALSHVSEEVLLSILDQTLRENCKTWKLELPPASSSARGATGWSDWLQAHRASLPEHPVKPGEKPKLFAVAAPRPAAAKKANAPPSRSSFEVCARCTDAAACAAHEIAERETLTLVEPSLASKDWNERLAGYRRLAALAADRVNAPSRAVAERLAKGLDDEKPEVAWPVIEMLVDGQHPEVAIVELCRKLDESAEKLARLQTLADRIAASKPAPGEKNKPLPRDPDAPNEESLKEQWRIQFEHTVTGQYVNAEVVILAKSLESTADDRTVDALVRVLERLEPPTGTGPGADNHERAVEVTSASLALLGARRGVEAVVVTLARVDDDALRAKLDLILRRQCGAWKLEPAPPAAGERIAPAWRDWFRANGAALPERMGGGGAAPPAK